MPQHLSWKTLQAITQSQSLDELSIPALTHLFHSEQSMQAFLPDALCQIDPRTGELTVYNSTRARRPHDTGQATHGQQVDEKPCVICQGNTTGVIDVAQLSSGWTFINKNLFPIIYPTAEVAEQHRQTPLYPDPEHKGRTCYGFHFLQWTSSEHDADWHTLSLEDSLIAMSRLAALEEKLLYESAGFMPPSELTPLAKPTYGFVSIIKNHGRLAGGSLAHGHQQIGYTNIMPSRFYHNWLFFKRHGKCFTKYLLEVNPLELQVRDYGPAVLIVPYFMRRPYDMLIVVKDTQKQYLHELSTAELQAVTQGIQDGMRGLLHIMPRLGREPAFNMTVSNGPGAGLYVEFLAYTQEIGGFEQLGLWVCQERPVHAAAYLREALA